MYDVPLPWTTVWKESEADTEKSGGGFTIDVVVVGKITLKLLLSCRGQ